MRKTFFALFFCTLFLFQLPDIVSAFPATATIDLEYSEHQPGQQNFRGVVIRMKSHAWLNGVSLAPGTTCDLVRIFDADNALLGEGTVVEGFAVLTPIELYKEQSYFVVAGDTSGMCGMQWNGADVNYVTQHVHFTGARNADAIQDGPIIAIKSLSLDVQEDPQGNGSWTSASETTLDVKANVIGDTVRFSISDAVDLGDISRGFASNPVRINITNSGNTDISISAQKIEGDDLFENIYLSKRLSGDDKDFRKADDFAVSILRPSVLGGERSDYFYMKLDLSDYAGSIPAGVNQLDAEFRFIAVAL